mmetsp:Transcript_118754/g.343462  ORF Transcript_118754/g.343462 Transcript_118754/m.343462 type:complete len:89 (+) Transcript_118754:72-338(+)
MAAAEGQATTEAIRRRCLRQPSASEGALPEALAPGGARMHPEGAERLTTLRVRCSSRPERLRHVGRAGVRSTPASRNAVAAKRIQSRQ